MKRSYLSTLLLVGALSFTDAGMASETSEITLIHTGDFHGHLAPRPNVRSDARGHSVEGGLARIYTVVKELREEDPQALLLHTGDTIQGSAEVLYTRGQAIVDVVNAFHIDAFAPGNWDFVYGTDRFLQLFSGPAATAPWNAIASNLYYSNEADSPYLDKAGQRVLPPYLVREVRGVTIGLLGFTTDRGPQVVGRNVTKGFRFLKNQAPAPGAYSEVETELQQQIATLRNVERVDLIVMLSELGLANNIRLAEKFPGLDVVFSSDMHEETSRAVVTSTGTIVVEEGQDGTMMGALKLKVRGGKIAKWNWHAYTITDDIAADPAIAAKVAEVRNGFVSGPDFVQYVNPFNGTKLQRPIDTVVGYTNTPLHRSNFSNEDMPAVIEGSSHDFLTDAFRAMTGADIGAIRGFRYGTHVRPGPIKMEDLYHFVPIGPQIAKGTIKGQALKNQIENAADGSLNPDVSQWTGGWLFNFSGVTMDIDPYQALGARASNVLVNGTPLNPAADYTYASYWYPADPNLINVVPATNIHVLKDENGEAMDGTEVVARYLQSLPNQTADPVLHRIHLVQSLPAPAFGNPEIQPLRGAQ